MKKFLFVLCLLIILAGTGLFLGWDQLTVPPGSYGVMRSKTHGLDRKVIQDGEFRWLWYKLIPTNVKISVYTIEPVTRSIQSSGTLSSAQTYAALAGLEADFSWELSGEISFALKPETLPELTDRENIASSEDLRRVEETLARRIESFILTRLKNYGDDEQRMESIILSGTARLEEETKAAFPEIENFRCTIRTARYPDYALYRSVKKLHEEYLARQNAVLKPDIAREGEQRINTRMHLDELAQYGELLTKYPILLQYLALEKGVSPGEE
jgi:hypothetical protein